MAVFVAAAGQAVMLLLWNAIEIGLFVLLSFFIPCLTMFVVCRITFVLNDVSVHIE